MPDLSDLLPEEEPESRVELVEVMRVLGIALALMIAPGLIWWAIKLFDIGCVTLEALR